MTTILVLTNTNNDSSSNSDDIHVAMPRISYIPPRRRRRITRLMIIRRIHH